jgi:HTH-type transcriptional regulator / antitoxin HigA
MPTAIADDYKKLLSKTLPKVIETEAEYESVVGSLSELMGKGSRRTSSEVRLMRLLQLLVADYDQRHAMPPSKMPAHEALNYLLETSGRTPADLIRIFSQRSHVNEALNGKRKISADQARKLGALFCVNPGLFI